MLVDTFLEVSARRLPDKVALVAGGQRLTYRALDESAARVASGLTRLGVHRGARVVVHLENGVDAVQSIFGALKAGAAFVVVNSSTKADKLAAIVAHCGASAVITDARAGVAERLRALAPVVLVNGDASGPFMDFDRLAATEPEPLPHPRIDLDLAAIVYTSGSTGGPKGVILTHGNITSAATSITTYLEASESDVILNVLPLSFDYGLYQVLMGFAVGATIVLERSFAFPVLLLDTMVRERVTALPIVPTIAALLLRHDLRDWDLSALRYMTSTGAVMPPAHIARLRQELPGVRFFSMYGITECKRVSYLSPEDIDARPTSVGRPMPNVEVFVEDEYGQLRETGEGELIVRGSNVMHGYWNDPESTDRALRTGRYLGERMLRSGDRFRIDEAGYMYFLGRLDDTFKSRGQRVSPREVENVLYELPGITAAAVIGTPDDVLGMAVTAFVIVEDPVITERDIVRHCAGKLEDFMVPQVQLVSELPRTTSGKLDRRQLASERAS